MTTKLFPKDEAYIKRMEKKYGADDKRFASSSAAIRYYVGLGIKAENNAVETSETLEKALLRRDQKFIVAEQLLPIVNGFNELCDRIEALNAIQADYFANAEQKFADFESRFGLRTNRDEEQFGTAPESFVEQLSVSDKTSDAALRNLIILRIAFRLFLLEVKAGQIEPGRQSSAEWIHVIARVQERVRFVPIDEIKTLSEDTLETYVIRKGASAIFEGLALPPELAGE